MNQKRTNNGSNLVPKMTLAEAGRLFDDVSRIKRLLGEIGDVTNSFDGVSCATSHSGIAARLIAEASGTVERINAFGYFPREGDEDITKVLAHLQLVVYTMTAAVSTVDTDRWGMAPAEWSATELIEDTHSIVAAKVDRLEAEERRSRVQLESVPASS